MNLFFDPWQTSRTRIIFNCRYGTWGPLYDQYKDDYRTLTANIIRPAILELDTTRPFLSSSPSNGLVTEDNNWISEDPRPSDPNYGDSMPYFDHISISKTVCYWLLFIKMKSRHLRILLVLIIVRITPDLYYYFFSPLLQLYRWLPGSKHLSKNSLFLRIWLPILAKHGNSGKSSRGRWPCILLWILCA